MGSSLDVECVVNDDHHLVVFLWDDYHTDNEALAWRSAVTIGLKTTSNRLFSHQTMGGLGNRLPTPAGRRQASRNPSILLSIKVHTA